jgi:hypothetical protein
MTHSRATTTARRQGLLAKKGAPLLLFPAGQGREEEAEGGRAEMMPSLCWTSELEADLEPVNTAGWSCIPSRHPKNRTRRPDPKPFGS